MIHGHRGASSGIFEGLWDYGFKNLNIKDARGCTPIMLACARNYLDLAESLFRKGAVLHPECLWMCVRSLPNWRYFGPPDWMIERLSLVERDSCNCFCSTLGCMPATILARKPFLGFLAQRRVLDELLPALPPQIQTECYEESVRLEIVERLGMAHTCCRDDKDCSLGLPSKPRSWKQPSLEDIQGIEDEDSDLREILGKYMGLFHDLRDAFPGRFSAFLKAWRAAFDLHLPPEDAMQVS